MIWRKSSHSTTSNDCVEVTAPLPGLIRIRDSKRSSDPGPVVTTNPAPWTAFLTALRSGALY
ncbi:DUF397 domain-containing protein [Streptomyces luteireticuli]|uniref:DUF397 domain-containing protein n=1 Tax=Streptomyces luteireticuli TaxID=173858 RepID=A0ABN0Z0D0_9ACTN